MPQQLPIIATRTTYDELWASPVCAFQPFSCNKMTPFTLGDPDIVTIQCTVRIYTTTLPAMTLMKSDIYRAAGALCP